MLEVIGIFVNEIRNVSYQCAMSAKKNYFRSQTALIEMVC